MKFRIIYFLYVTVLFSYTLIASENFKLGDAVQTQFSGVITPKKDEKFPQQIKTLTNDYWSHYIDEIFIDIQSASLSIKNLTTTNDHIWDASVLQNTDKLNIKAKDIGQVFGIALDDRKNPNIYVTATSFYGLNIVLPDIPNEIKIKNNSKNSKEKYKIFITNDKDLRPERQLLGIKNAKWMNGQFGKNGTPGTIWKINTKTKKVSKLIDIKLKGKINSGPALGNITFDSKHKQLFVSDLDTGMIHRISTKGQDLEHFDHGIKARKLYNLRLIPHNPLNITDINSRDFDTTNTNTWGYASIGRRVYGLSYIQNRLFYSVYNGKDIPAEIWSVGIDKKGKFTNNIRLEVKLNKLEKNLPITDMIVTNEGEMILSQRPMNQGSYSMSNFITNDKAQTIIYHLKVQNKGYLQRWYQEPQEYFVGFDNLYRKGLGGISLGYNYTNKGKLDYSLCNKTLWITGENLRKSRKFDSILGQNVDGVQGVSKVLTNVNKPAWNSLFTSTKTNNFKVKGYIGDIEIYQKKCICKCSTANYSNIITKNNKNIIYPLTHPNMPSNLNTPSSTSTGGEMIFFPPPNCFMFPSLPGCSSNNNNNESAKLCMEAKTTPAGPFNQGGGLWSFPIALTSLNSNTIDSVKITPISGVTAITNGPIFPVGTPSPILTGVSVGNDAVVNLCGFDSTKAQSGEPFECCNMKVKIKIRSWNSDEDNQQLEVVR
jgi:hypothetical protein